MRPNYIKGQLRQGRKKINLTCISAVSRPEAVELRCFAGEGVVAEILLSSKDAKRLARQLLSGTIGRPGVKWLFTSLTKLEVVDTGVSDLNENM